MTPPSTTINKIVLTLAIILLLAALAIAMLAPGFSCDNGLVYGAF
jgi:hypothetical protein